ncbi:MAG: ComF family protein [Erythrobacter sp.]
MILRFKHGGKLSLAKLLGGMMAGHVPDAGGAGSTDQPPLLVPVPLHRTRIWDRGFNQSALLARELAKRGKGALVVDALIRRKKTPSLGGLGREARRGVLENAIGIRESRRGRVKGSDILLVDDVLTSGATTGACVDALLDAGASSVKIVCFARVVDS